MLKSRDQVEHEYEKNAGQDAAASETRRSKRSAADRPYGRRKRIVETLVVADSQLVRNHENDRVDVTTYILTVMNMVSFSIHSVLE